MKLQHIELSKLKLSPVNVRKHGGKDVSDLVASIRSLGVIQPLLVRPNCEGFEVVAGQRRLLACQALEQETGKADPVPCAVLDTGDDAAAIEASLAENTTRLPMDEIDQYDAFATLKAKGRTIADIASQFGVTELLVKKRLAFLRRGIDYTAISREYLLAKESARREESGSAERLAQARKKRLQWFKDQGFNWSVNIALIMHYDL